MEVHSSSKRYEPPHIDLENENSGHTHLVNFTGFNKKVLEIGTSTGYISKILKDRGNTITGIEIDHEAGLIAQQFCDQMIIGDVETLDLDKNLEQASFDVILCGDVLEHLKKPADILKKVQKFLKPQGYLVVSLPNFCHGDVLLNLFNSDFHCTSLGLLDETHLHFFGLRNIFSLFAKCGYQLSDLHTTTLEIGETELKTDMEKVPRNLLKFLRSLPNTNTYQFIFIASPSKNVTVPVFDDIDLNKILPDSLEESLHNLRLEFSRELSIRDQKFQENTAHTQYLEQALREKEQHIKNLDEYIHSLNETISEKEQHNKDLDEYIHSLNETISEKEQHNKDLDEYILGLKEMIAAKELDHRKVDEYSISLGQAIKDKEQHIKNLDEHIQSLKDTIDEKEHHCKQVEEYARLTIIVKDNLIKRMNCHIKSLEKQLSYLIKK